MLRKVEKMEKRLKKTLWRRKQPAWAENHGVWLPCKQPAIAAKLAGIDKICLETHTGVIGDDGVSGGFARLLEQGFVLDFDCIRKNVFFFYRPH